MIGAAELAKARADGYTIGFMPPGPIVLQQYQRQLPYDSGSFDYLGMVSEYPVVLMSGKKVPWTNYQEMLAELKAHPNTYLYGSPGIGAIPHIAAAVLFKTEGAEVRHMPGTDAASNLGAIAGGTIHFYADMVAHAKIHDLLPLVVFDEQRIPEFPDAPTIRELGVDIPNLLVWQGILAPRGIPADVFKILDEAIYQAVQSPEFQEAAVRMEVPPRAMRAEEFAQYTQQSMEDFRVVMTALGFDKK